MYQELTEIISVKEIETFFSKNSFHSFFTDDEIKAIQNKNKIKSLGARYLIKKAVLDYYHLEDSFKKIEIVSGKNGKPELILKDQLKTVIQNKIHISLSHSRSYISTLVVID